MKGRKLKSSERILLIVLTCVLIFTVYIAFPMRKHLTAIEYTKGSRDLAFDELEGTMEPKDPVPDIDRLSSELAWLIKEREGLEKRLAALGGDFYTAEKPGLLEELNLRIANLASESGIWIRENVPLNRSDTLSYSQKNYPRQDYSQQNYSPRDRKDGYVLRNHVKKVESIPILPDDIKDRPFRKLEMVATYPGFRKFIDAFCKLSSRMVVAGFSIETDPRDVSMPGPPLLKIELIWVLI